MSAIAIRNQFSHLLAPSAKRTATRDIWAAIASWDERAIFRGALFGFAFGAILVAIPLATDVLIFGAFGTLMIAVVECAVIAAGFAALAAALSDSDNGQTLKIVTTPVAERQTAAARR